jgi:hypothetical protein
MRYYHLNRLVDETGNSGVGVVAEVVVSSNGTAIVLWSEESNALGVASIVVYPGGLADAEKVHGHGGKTLLEGAELTAERQQELRWRIEIASRKLHEVAFELCGTRPHANLWQEGMWEE